MARGVPPDPALGRSYLVCAFDMLTLQEVERGKTKCARFWPDQDATEEYGGFAVLNIIKETGKDYTLRQFLVSRKMEA